MPCYSEKKKESTAVNLKAFRLTIVFSGTLNLNQSKPTNVGLPKSVINRAVDGHNKYRKVVGELERNSARAVSGTDFCLNILSTNDISIRLTPCVVYHLLMNLKSHTHTHK